MCCLGQFSCSARSYCEEVSCLLICTRQFCSGRLHINRPLYSANRPLCPTTLPLIIPGLIRYELELNLALALIAAPILYLFLSRMIEILGGRSHKNIGRSHKNIGLGLSKHLRFLHNSYSSQYTLIYNAGLGSYSVHLIYEY